MLTYVYVPCSHPQCSLPQKIASCPFLATSSWVFSAQIDLCVLETKPKRIRKHASECVSLICPTAHLAGVCSHNSWGFIAERHAIIWIEGSSVTWLSFFLSLSYCEHFCTSCFVDTHFYLGRWLLEWGPGSRGWCLRAVAVAEQFSRPCQHLVLSVLCNCGHFGECKMVPHRGFSLHFSDD